MFTHPPRRATWPNGECGRVLAVMCWSLEPLCTGAVSPADRALCLPTFSHLLIVNKSSRSLSLRSPLPLAVTCWGPSAQRRCYPTGRYEWGVAGRGLGVGVGRGGAREGEGGRGRERERTQRVSSSSKRPPARRLTLQGRARAQCSEPYTCDQTAPQQTPAARRHGCLAG